MEDFLKFLIDYSPVFTIYCESIISKQDYVEMGINDNNLIYLRPTKNLKINIVALKNSIKTGKIILKNNKSIEIRRLGDRLIKYKFINIPSTLMKDEEKLKIFLEMIGTLVSFEYDKFNQFKSNSLVACYSKITDLNIKTVYKHNEGIMLILPVYRGKCKRCSKNGYITKDCDKVQFNNNLGNPIVENSDDLLIDSIIMDNNKIDKIDKNNKTNNTNNKEDVEWNLVKNRKSSINPQRRSNNNRNNNNSNSSNNNNNNSNSNNNNNNNNNSYNNNNNNNNNGDNYNNYNNNNNRNNNKAYNNTNNSNKKKNSNYKNANINKDNTVVNHVDTDKLIDLNVNPIASTNNNEITNLVSIPVLPSLPKKKLSIRKRIVTLEKEDEKTASKIELSKNKNSSTKNIIGHGIVIEDNVVYTKLSSDGNSEISPSQVSVKKRKVRSEATTQSTPEIIKSLILRYPLFGSPDKTIGTLVPRLISSIRLNSPYKGGVLNNILNLNNIEELKEMDEDNNNNNLNKNNINNIDETQISIDSSLSNTPVTEKEGGKNNL